MGRPNLNWHGLIQGHYDAALDRYTTSIRELGLERQGSHYREQDTIDIWWVDRISPSEILGFAFIEKGVIGITGLLRSAIRYPEYQKQYYVLSLPNPPPVLDQQSFARKDTATILAHEIGHILGLDHHRDGGSSSLMFPASFIERYLEALEIAVPFEQTRTMIAHLCGNVPLANFKDLYGDRFINLARKGNEITCNNGVVGESLRWGLESCEPENTSSLGQCLDQSRPLPQIAAGRICNRLTCQCEGTLGGPSSSSPLPTASAIPSNGTTPYTPGSGSTTCGNSAPACDGMCGGGKSCKPQSNGSCKCQKPCGPSGAPACEGFCDDGESCKKTDDGCSCVKLCGAMDASQCRAGWCPGNQPCWDMGQGCRCEPDPCRPTEQGTACAGNCPPGLYCGLGTGSELCGCVERRLLEPQALEIPGLYN